MAAADANDPGILSAREISLLCDFYELTMAASYHREGRDELAVFELFVRQLPANRDWLLVAGIGPALRLIREMGFEEDALAYLRSLGFEDSFLERLSSLRFSGEIDAMPEGTLCFANEPIVRVTAPRIEAQLLETLLLNQINFQTMAATKAARLVLAAGGGEPDVGGRVVDFSPRRDQGIDAAMKVARSAAIAGCGGTSNVAAAMRYGLRAVGTMAHSYVLSFPTQREAFEAFLRAFPERATLLVDTYDVEGGVGDAIAAARSSGVVLGGIRIDSGDLYRLSWRARELLNSSGMNDTEILVSGDLEESRIAELVERGAPIDGYGVGTDLGTSRDSPVVNGIYKLVADAQADGGWRGVRKLSEQKQTLPAPKQVFRQLREEKLAGDVIALADEELAGKPLLVPMMRGGEIVHEEGLTEMRERAQLSLRSLPGRLRHPLAGGADPFPVELSAELAELSDGS